MKKKNNSLDKITGMLFIVMLIILAMFVALIPVMIYPDRYGLIVTVIFVLAGIIILLKST